jgi:transcriptional regulator with XRE-family HTH domain
VNATRLRPEFDIRGDGHFGERLRAVRIDQGWSQSEAAKAAGVTSRTYSAWENDGVVPPPGPALRGIAFLLRVRPGWLLTGQPDPRPHDEEERHADD